MKDSFKPTHENENLTRLLGNDYSQAIEDILKQAESNQGSERFDKQVLTVLPSIKEEIDKHLATKKNVDL